MFSLFSLLHSYTISILILQAKEAKKKKRDIAIATAQSSSF
jgi:hypothetical protein